MDDRNTNKIEVGDIVICNDMLGFVTDTSPKDVTIRDKEGRYRTVSRNLKGLGLVVNAYAQSALIYKNIMGGKQ